MSSQTQPFFGRAWKLTVATLAGGTLTVSSETWTPEPLKICFQVEQTPLGKYWTGAVEIYNCAEAMTATIRAGDLVTLEAGYQNPGPGVIFQGRVFQPIWERVGATDYRLTLHCLIGLWEDEHTNISIQIKAGSNAFEAAQQISDAAQQALSGADPGNPFADNLPWKIEYLDPTLQSSSRLPRAVPFEGNPSLALAKIALDAGVNYWRSYKGVNIAPLAPDPKKPQVPEIIYAPPFSAPSSSVTTDNTSTAVRVTRRNTLIGNPVQTDMGVSFRVLLDHELRLGQLIKLENALIDQIRLQFGQRPPVLDAEGIYIVGRIGQEGDSRGGGWYTTVDGITREQSRLAWTTQGNVR